MSYGPRGFAVGVAPVLVAALMGAGAAPAAEVRELEQREARKPQPARIVRRRGYVVERSLLPPCKKRPRVSTRKPPKRGKTAAALRRYGYSRC